ncbi:hypothetical protein FISHEDRAFT_54971 [Fistulina hepatica ATCC 64428]|uniref:Uncharacterized protein n=1 Tax=Fistulina hepatica ATCC 64428 TaxID=1128425 RepID=A0A0D7AQB8_9AGAR|nr:hypothetical protein FISHEDRAFT_54971 [Fistulina hepatica ATCC 64428]
MKHWTCDDRTSDSLLLVCWAPRWEGATAKPSSTIVPSEKSSIGSFTKRVVRQRSNRSSPYAYPPRCTVALLLQPAYGVDLLTANVKPLLLLNIEQRKPTIPNWQQNDHEIKPQRFLDSTKDPIILASTALGRNFSTWQSASLIVIGPPQSHVFYAIIDYLPGVLGQPANIPWHLDCRCPTTEIDPVWKITVLRIN